MEPNVPRYSPASETVAREIAVTPNAEMSTADRWSRETVATLELIIQAVGSRSPSAILDFGTGPGRLLEPLLRRFPSSKILAVDTSAAMLVHARGNVSSESVSRVTWRSYESISELESAVPPNSVDLALCIYVLQHVDRGLLPRVVEVISRAIRASGLLFTINMNTRAVPLLTNDEGSGGTRDRAIHSVAIHDVPKQNAWTDDGVDVLGMLRQHFHSAETLELPSAGFAEVTRATHSCVVFRK